MQINDKHKRFADEYLIDPSAPEAYLRAKYKATSRNSARAAACRLLMNVNVQKYLVEKKMELARQASVDRARVIRALLTIVSAKISDFLTPDGNHLKERDIPPDLLAAVAHMSKSKHRFSITLVDRMAVLDKLCKLLGFGIGPQTHAAKRGFPPMNIEPPSRLTK